jgi:hypothetical protein
MAQHIPNGEGQPVPADVVSLAAANQLGPLVTGFGPNPMRTRNRGAIVGVGFGVVGVVLLFTDFWPMGIFALLGFVLLAVLYARTFATTRSPRRIYLFGNGFVHVDPPAAATVYRFDRISAVYLNIVTHRRNSLPTYTTHQYTVEAAAGRLVLTDFWDRVTTLGEAVERGVAEAHLPIAMAALRQGQPVRFGDLSLQAAGLVSDRQGTLPWAEIAKVRVNSGFVEIARAGARGLWANKPVATIPNVSVFLAMVEGLRAGAGR